MARDNDAEMLDQLGNAIVDLEVKFRASSLQDRMIMRPQLQDLLDDDADYRLRLLKEGIITTDADLEEMKSIQAEIDSAAEKEALIKALVHLAAFVAAKV